MKQLIDHTGKYILLPESIDEIDGRQLVAIAEFMHSPVNSINQWLKLLRSLSSQSLIQFYLLVSTEMKMAGLEHITWVLDDWSISRQLLPSYRGMHGPKSELDNVTLAEFYFSEKCYADYIESQSVESLDTLVAVLYRMPKKKYDISRDPDGDIRLPFNSNSTWFLQKKVSRWPLKVKQAILLWYDGCRKKITEDNPDIFSGGQSGDSSDSDMFGIMRSLAGGKYGDFYSIEKMLLHTALLEMNFMIAESKRAEAELKRK